MRRRKRQRTLGYDLVEYWSPLGSVCEEWFREMRDDPSTRGSE